MQCTFYFSFVNDKDSRHGNSRVFGWNEKCPNYIYRTTIEPKDEKGSIIPAAVTVTKASGETVGTGTGKLAAYLYPSQYGEGTYTASATGGSNKFTLQTFTVTDKAQIVVIPAISVPVTGVTLDKSSMTIDAGDSEALTATIAPSKAANINVTWKSSNTAVATVNSSGVVTAVTPGTATITITTEDGYKSANCVVTVKPVPVTGVTLNKSTTSVYIRSTDTLIETVEPSNATNKNVTWSSSNTAVAAVDNKGVVTGVSSSGTAIITVKTEDGNFTDTCIVAASETPISVISVDLKPTTTLYIGGNTETLEVEFDPSNATNKNVTWSSSNPAVASVTNGLVTPISEGTATITVTTQDGSKTATCAVTVRHKTLMVSAGDGYTLAIDEVGSLWAWGNNYYGQLGNGDDSYSGIAHPTPVKIKEGTKFTSVSAGEHHTLAIDEVGSLWAWGDNYYGQLGDGTTDYRTTPLKIKDGTKFTSVSAGQSHTLAIDTDGDLWTWGSNANGQLGDGTTVSKNTPVKIMVGTKFTSVSASWSHTLAIDADGGLWAWGHNDYGQLGDGTTADKTMPVKIMAGTKFTGVSAGKRWHTLAIDADSDLWAWGSNAWHRLGDGSYISSNTPVKINGETKFTSVSAGHSHTMAIDVDGRFWAGGQNSYGQFGDGTWDQ